MKEPTKIRVYDWLAVPLLVACFFLGRAMPSAEVAPGEGASSAGPAREAEPEPKRAVEPAPSVEPDPPVPPARPAPPLPDYPAIADRAAPTVAEMAALSHYVMIAGHNYPEVALRFAKENEDLLPFLSSVAVMQLFRGLLAEDIDFAMEFFETAEVAVDRERIAKSAFGVGSVWDSNRVDELYAFFADQGYESAAAIGRFQVLLGRGQWVAGLRMLESGPLAERGIRNSYAVSTALSGAIRQADTEPEMQELFEYVRDMGDASGRRYFIRIALTDISTSFTINDILRCIPPEDSETMASVITGSLGRAEGMGDYIRENVEVLDSLSAEDRDSAIVRLANSDPFEVLPWLVKSGLIQQLEKRKLYSFFDGFSTMDPNAAADLYYSNSEIFEDTEHVENILRQNAVRYGAEELLEKLEQ